MDALTSLGIDGKLLLSQVVNFLILLLILKKLLYGPIIKMLSDRKDKIAKAMEDAKAAEEKLMAAEKQSQQIIEKAIGEAEKIAKSSKKSAEDESAQLITGANERARKINDAAKESAEKEKNQIVQKAKSDLAELVTLATEKVLQEKQNSTDISRVVKQIK